MLTGHMCTSPFWLKRAALAYLYRYGYAYEGMRWGTKHAEHILSYDTAWTSVASNSPDRNILYVLHIYI